MELLEQFINHFNSKDIKIKVYPEQREKVFKTFEDFYNYIKKECDFWSEYRNVNNTNKIHNYFSNIFNTLESAKSYAENSNLVNNSFQQLDNAISHANYGSFPCIYSTTRTAKLIAAYYEKNPDQADAICDYLFTKQLKQTSNMEYFKGILNIHLHENKGINITDLDSYTQAFEAVINTNNDELNKLHSHYHMKINETSTNSSQFKEELSEWRNSIETNTKEFLDDKRKEMIRLENLYNENLE
jgi:hypothetical protein